VDSARADNEELDDEHARISQRVFLCSSHSTFFRLFARRVKLLKTM
jgi:hypothetical protein